MAKFKVGDVIKRISYTYDRRVILSVGDCRYEYQFLWGGCVKDNWDSNYIDSLFKLDDDFVVSQILSKYSNVEE